MSDAKKSWDPKTPWRGTLKPCPKCGSERLTIKCLLGLDTHWAQCRDCEHSGPFCDTHEEAIASWNKQEGG